MNRGEAYCIEGLDAAMPDDQSELMMLVRAIAAGDTPAALRLLGDSPALGTERVRAAASRANAGDYLFEEIRHYVYGRDTALHVTAAAYAHDIARKLIELGADVRAKNRRGAEPLHYAADGVPGSQHWRPEDQAATIAVLIEAGADPNAVDSSGVTPLHRAVRTRCAAAVRALLEGGADSRQQNKNGSTPIDLATRTTGRGGSGSPAAKEQQAEILRLFGR